MTPLEGRSRPPRARRAPAVRLWVLLALALAGAACASTQAGTGDAGVGDDGGAPDAGIDAPPGEPTGVLGAFCAGGGRSRAGAGPSDPTHIACVGPADLAAHERRKGTIRWQPGPIYVVTP